MVKMYWENVIFFITCNLLMDLPNLFFMGALYVVSVD